MIGIRLRHLMFTGPDIKPAGLDFVDGLNIVYGASNTGKSFAAEAVLFAIGAVTTLDETDEIRAYDAVWLGVTLGDEGEFTLYRPTSGGNLKIFPGLVWSDATGRGNTLGYRHNQKRTDTVSHRILEALGLQDRWIVRDSNGTKESLSIRLLSKYAVVGEQDIMSKSSPVCMSGIPSNRTLEQNIFKLLLTGKDDSAAVSGPNETARVAAKKGKLEILDELLAQLDPELGDTPMDLKGVRDKLTELEASGQVTFLDLQSAQATLDAFLIERRTTVDRVEELSARAGEIDLMLERFVKLQAVYSSDLDRLQSIEEGGSLLAAMTGRDCPVCGAPHAAQKHFHAAEEVSMAHTAAAAEARKIEREQRELANVMGSLQEEVLGVRTSIVLLSKLIEEFDDHIQSLRPAEASLRRTYETYSTERAQLLKVIDLHERRDNLARRRAEIDAAPTRRENDAPAVGPDSTVLFEFGETVKAVLAAWGFPNADKVQFNGEANDITVAGKKRSANGKGVRAVMHAAFKVAVVVHCIEKGLPYPGFLVLDSPLLTYREPKSRHGKLSPDEVALKQTSLAEKFYKHLASLEDKLQVIVIENSDPPEAIENLAHIELFTGLVDDGRYGLLAHLLA
jgi:hypothetical protein